MKKAIIFISLFVSMGSFAQVKLLEILPLKDGKVTYTEVVKVDTLLNKDEIYKRVKRWFVDTYKSGKDVIQLDDKDNGEVIGKGNFSVLWQINFMGGMNINIWETIKINIKDGRYKYEITDFRAKYLSLGAQGVARQEIDMALEDWNKGRDDNNKKVYPKIDTEVQTLINSLNKAVKTPINDNW
jgi:hypothetical protein